MIFIRQARNVFSTLLLVLITVLAVACMVTGSDNSGTSTPSSGIATVTTPGSSNGSKTPGTAYASGVYHPNIRIGPTRGRAGTEVTVVGAGFPPYSEVQIRLTGQETGAPKEYIAKTEAQQHGNIQVSFIVPERWPSGELITLPQINVLASTPDFADKATAPFTYETNVTPEATP